jgi:hypothetical protein
MCLPDRPSAPHAPTQIKAPCSDLDRPPPALPALVVSHATCLHGSCMRIVHNYFNTCKQVAFVYFGHECNSMHVQLLAVLYTEAGTEGQRAWIFVRCCTALVDHASCGLVLVLPCRSCFVGSCPAHGATVQPCLSNGATAFQSGTLWSCTRRYSHSKVCFENKKNDSCSADLIPDSCYKFNLFYLISKTKSYKI